jgi:hypothetical protein
VVDRDGLAGELKAFRKGRAAQHPHFVQRLGSRVRRLTGIAETDPLPAARAKLRDWVERSMGDQPADLLLAAMVGFALHDEARQETLVERQQWLARQRDFHPRTARRRMDEALDAILAAVHEQDGSPPPGAAGSDWRVCSLEAVLRLTTDGPTLMERRVIEFAAPEVDEITSRLSVPRPDGKLSAPSGVLAETLFGVRIVERQQPSDDHYQYRLRLPRQFRAGERHEYAMTFQIPAGQRMASHYVMQPLTPCDEFTLVVRFDMRRAPGAVWVLDEVAPRVVDSDRPSGTVVAPDRLGELHRTFRDLRQGFAYGIKWRP